MRLSVSSSSSDVHLLGTFLLDSTVGWADVASFKAGFPPAVQRTCDGAVLGTITSPADGNALEVTLSL